MFSSFHSLADTTNNETLTETIFLGHTRVALFKEAVSGECCCRRSILLAEVITSCFYPFKFQSMSILAIRSNKRKEAV